MERNNEQFTAEFEKFMDEYMKDLVVKRGSHIRRFPMTVFNAVSALLIGSLGLIAALAWDNYLHYLFSHLFPENHGLWLGFVYAVFITTVAVTVAVFLGRRSESKK